MMLPLDAHAHIEPGIDPADLIRLRSCVIAVTRTQADFEVARRRSDASVIWAAGCHPGLVREVKAFSASYMREAVASTPVIGEIGLDGSARTPMDVQLAVLRNVLAIADEVPRLLSIHSYQATDLVLKELRHFRPKGAILHWWLGTANQTAEAVGLGAYFSVNASQVKKWESLKLVPPERLLLETDHPFGDRAQTPPRRPGHLVQPETALSALLGLTLAELRSQTWRNLRGIVSNMALIDMFPREFQVQFLAA